MLQTLSYGWKNLPLMFLGCWALKPGFEITVLGPCRVESSRTWDKFKVWSFETSSSNSNSARLEFEMQMFTGLEVGLCRFVYSEFYKILCKATQTHCLLTFECETNWFIKVSIEANGCRKERRYSNANGEILKEN